MAMTLTQDDLDAIIAAMNLTPPAVNVTMWKDATAPAMTGDAYARLGAPAGASVSADVAAVKSDTYTEAVFVPSSNVIDGGPVDVQARRQAAGTAAMFRAAWRR